MIINQKEIIVETTEDTTKIFQGVRKNIDGNYEMVHVDKDAWIIELVNNTDEEGYISFKRAPPTLEEPSFTEIIRINFDGTMIFHSLTEAIAVTVADTLKLFAKDYSGRTVMAKRDDTDEAYLVEGKGFSRIWRQDTQPAGAKVWDIWIDSSGS